MSESEPKNRLPGLSVGDRNNESRLEQEPSVHNNLPMGQQQKRGRRPRANSPFTKNFSNLLREKNCSHRQAAKIAGVAPSVISGWTAGSIPNDPVAVLKITEALGGDFQFIMTNVPSNMIPTERLTELFEIEDRPELKGLFMVDIRRMRSRK